MFLGIEIGGTKLQLGVGSGGAPPLVALERLDVDRDRGAEGICEQIERVGRSLIARHEVAAVGVGFGGPVDAATGRVIKSHQIDGWDGFPLADWCRKSLDRPAVIANDSDSAGVAEARFGAGQTHRIVFYTNVGSGIGGALVIDGMPYRGSAGIAAELGHLRPGLQADRAEATVESLASGWAIAEAAKARLGDPVSHPAVARLFADKPREPESIRRRLAELEQADEASAAELLRRCDGRIEQLSAGELALAAGEGNKLAGEIFGHAAEALGWAIAQMITLLAPEVVVVGGGVAQSGEALFFAPLRKEVNRYVFPPLAESYRIVPAALGEEMVVHGAIALAADCGSGSR